MTQRDLGAKQVEALTVAMIVAPGVYVRNRMFDFFASPGARRARARAAILRGIVPQLARASAVSLASEVRHGEAVYVLRYVIAALRLTRVVELSSAEVAALRLVTERASVRALPPSLSDRAVVADALAGLLDGDVGGDVSRLARDIVAPSAER